MKQIFGVFKILFFFSFMFAVSCSNPSILSNSNEIISEESEYVPVLEKVVYSTIVGENHPSTGVLSMVDQSIWGSATYPLGANFVSGAGSDATFAVFAKNATKILLEIYSAKTGENALYDYWMVKGADNIWRAKLKTVPNGTLFAFRVWGANWTFSSSWVRGNSATGFVSDVDSNGNRYNPNKVLYDPYSKEISHDKETPERDEKSFVKDVFKNSTV